MPAPILKRPRLVALGASPDPAAAAAASNMMAEVPRREAPSVKTEDLVMNGFTDSAATFRVTGQMAEPLASIIKQHRADAVGSRAIHAGAEVRCVLWSARSYFGRVSERGRRR